MTRDPIRLARKIARAIERDLCDRRGLKHEWERIEPSIQREIRAEWQRLIIEELEVDRAEG